MSKLLTTASAIALVLGLQGCANLPGMDMMGSSQSANGVENRGYMQQQMALADAAMSSGNSGVAVRMYRQLAADYPLSAEPRLHLGDALLAAGAPQEAARAFEGANMLGSTYRGHVGLGRVQLALRQPALALEQFDKASRAKPDDSAALNGMAVALDELGRHEEAQKVYVALLAKDPSNLRVRNNYALSLALGGKYDDAADILTSLVEAPDAEERIRQNLALVYGLAGNDGQAGHYGRMDLDEDAVNGNLEFYQRMRNLDSPAAKTRALTRPSASLAPKAVETFVDAAHPATGPGYASAGSPASTTQAAPVIADLKDVSTLTAVMAAETPAPAAKAPPAKPSKAKGKDALLSLPMTRAEAASLEVTRPAPAATIAAAAPKAATIAPAEEKAVSAAEPAKVAPVERQVASTSAAPVTPTSASAIHKPAQARLPAVPAVPPLAANAPEKPVQGEKQPVEASIKGAGVSGSLEGNTADAGIRRPAVPALL